MNRKLVCTLPGDRKKELDFIRALSIIGVVVIHISAALIDPSVDRLSYWVSITVNQLSRFCVPAFLIVSGILAYSSYEKNDYRSLLEKRSIDLIVPFILWTIIGLIMVPSDKSLAYIFLTGKGAFYQLYYIPLLMQMYLLLPLIKKIALNKRLLVLPFLLSVTVLTAFEWLELTKSSSSEAATFMYKIMPYTFFVWVLYFAIGFLIGKHYETFRTYMSSQPIWKFIMTFAAGSLVLTIDLYTNWMVNADFSTNLLNFYRPAVILYSIGAFALLYKIGLNQGSVLMHKVYVNSFGIYLNHVAVIILLEAVSNNYFFSNALFACIAFLLTMFISYFITEAIRLTPFATIFLGQKGLRVRSKARSAVRHESTIRNSGNV